MIQVLNGNEMIEVLEAPSMPRFTQKVSPKEIEFLRSINDRSDSIRRAQREERKAKRIAFKNRVFCACCAVCFVLGYVSCWLMFVK